MKRNIKIANNRGGYSVPIGESIVLYILEIYKNSAKFLNNNKIKNGRWIFLYQNCMDKELDF
ncbi:hypothetical protein [Clostridioides difficile]|uniref:hypothetical protein n=1 Tax=Clostridioides difficile TaxID=1496 RepID=UPI002ED32783